jgi:hypothetical protein
MTAPDPRQSSPLALAVLSSDILQADTVIALVDGIINLVAKASLAIEQGDRARAHALIDRAERRLPDDASVPEAHLGGIVEARNALARLRETADALPAPAP